MTRRCRSDERGSGTFLLAAVGVVFMVAVWVSVSLVGWWSCLHAADDAADTAALAGARARLAGEDGCAVARSTLGRNGVTVTDCSVEATSVDFVLTVSATVDLRPAWAVPGVPRRVTRTSRAGPVQ